MSEAAQTSAIPNLNSAHLPDRNSSCRCGSGKKYKKCCLYADQHNLEQARQFVGENYGANYLIVPDLSKAPLYPWTRHGFPGVGKYKKQEPVTETLQTQAGELSPSNQVPEPPTEVQPIPVE